MHKTLVNATVVAAPWDKKRDTSVTSDTLGRELPRENVGVLEY